MPIGSSLKSIRTIGKITYKHKIKGRETNTLCLLSFYYGQRQYLYNLYNMIHTDELIGNLFIRQHSLQKSLLSFLSISSLSCREEIACGKGY